MTSRSRHVRSGLSLVELLIAIFVVAVGILGTLSALWYGIRSEKYSERRSVAIFQARELISQIRANNYPFNPTYIAAGSDLNDGDYDNDGDDGGTQRPFNAPPFSNDFPDNPFNFQRRVEMKQLSNNPDSHLFNMAAIKVSVYWPEGGVEKKVTLWSYHRRQ